MFLQIYTELYLCLDGVSVHINVRENRSCSHEMDNPFGTQDTGRRQQQQKKQHNTQK